jgi:hypothetical protein
MTPAAWRLLEAVRGCTFDDFLFSPQRSVLERRDPAGIDLSCRFQHQVRSESSDSYWADPSDRE